MKCNCLEGYVQFEDGNWMLCWLCRGSGTLPDKISQSPLPEEKIKEMFTKKIEELRYCTVTVKKPIELKW